MITIEEMWEKLPFIWNGKKMHWTMARLSPNKVHISPGWLDEPNQPSAIGPIREALITVLDKLEIKKS